MAEGEKLRSVLVTGSGSGIGAAIARRLAKPGTGILVHALHNRAGCDAVAAELRQAGATVEVMLGDLSKPETGGLLVERACKAFGGLDVLIANAGFPDRRPFGTLERAGLDYCIGVITGGFFELVSAGLPHLRKSRDARVIAISTHNAHVFRTDYPVYPASAAAKAGLEAMVRVAAVQLAPDGITVNAVAPAWRSSAATALQPARLCRAWTRMPVPGLARRRAIAAPMPLPEPVTRTDRSLSPSAIFSSSPSSPTNYAPKSPPPVPTPRPHRGRGCRAKRGG